MSEYIKAQTYQNKTSFVERKKAFTFHVSLQRVFNIKLAATNSICNITDRPQTNAINNFEKIKPSENLKTKLIESKIKKIIMSRICNKKSDNVRNISPRFELTGATWVRWQFIGGKASVEGKGGKWGKCGRKGWESIIEGKRWEMWGEKVGLGWKQGTTKYTKTEDWKRNNSDI